MKIACLKKIKGLGFYCDGRGADICDLSSTCLHMYMYAWFLYDAHADSQRELRSS